ncbi:hypothetical protein [Flavobacterium rhizosphaerae]|uniref:Lipoprotein n=1 Tax=Flavobacterium rhizosphaerae TaxID=3163298 RepID=A0ABW8YX16_9FLAO
MKNMFKLLFVFAFAIILFTGCNDDLTPVYEEQYPGKIVIRGYNALTDSLQVTANGELLEINNELAFTGTISKDYQFVFYNNQAETISILNKQTGEVLTSYTFTSGNISDTLSFYYNDGIFLNDVLSYKPGVLSATGRTGYRFIFPTLNRYSNSGYNGALDAIIKKVNGEVLGVAENITKESFSTFVEFAYAPPPIINIELVKHGTTEPYITGQPVVVQLVMQNNKSGLIVLNETANENGAFSGVDATINLVDYFNY